MGSNEKLILFFLTNTIHMVQGERFKSGWASACRCDQNSQSLEAHPSACSTIKVYEQGHGAPGLLSDTLKTEIRGIWMEKTIVLLCLNILNVKEKNTTGIQPLHLSFLPSLVREIVLWITNNMHAGKCE